MLCRFLAFFFLLTLAQAEGVRFATYNIKDYLLFDRRVEGVFRKNYPKPEYEKKALWAVIKKAKPDVLALQEIGGQAFLEELQRDLKTQGEDFPYAIIFADPKVPARYTAVLSKKPLLNPDSQTFKFDYFGHNEVIKRGLLEVTIQSGKQTCTLFVVHLKSRLAEEKKDPRSAYFRESEAMLIRDYLWKRYVDQPNALFLVVGDFNDAPQSPTLHLFLKRGQKSFMQRVTAQDARGETWTHHYGKEEGYSCFDYILASKALASTYLVDKKGVIVDIPESMIASDHRLLYLDINFTAPQPTQPPTGSPQTPSK